MLKGLGLKGPVKPSISRKEPTKVKPGPTTPAIAEPVETIRRWARAFTSRNPNDVLRFYAPSEDLIVILSSGHQFKGYAQVKELYEKSPQAFSFFESEVSELIGGRSQDVAWVNCRHRARYRVRTDDSQWQLEVRTTFVLKRDKDDWRIVLEHSSPLADVPRMKPLPTGQRAAVDPPKTAVNTFNRVLALLKAGDIDAAAMYFDAPGPEMAEGLKRAANRLKSGQLTVTLVDSKEEGDLAVVIVKAVDVDEGGEAGALHEANAMKRKDGTWRVYPTTKRAAATKAMGEAVAKGKIEAPSRPKKDVPPSLGEPDIKLEGADREKMAALWKWA